MSFTRYLGNTLGRVVFSRVLLVAATVSCCVFPRTGFATDATGNVRADRWQESDGYTDPGKYLPIEAEGLSTLVLPLDGDDYPRAALFKVVVPREAKGIRLRVEELPFSIGFGANLGEPVADVSESQFLPGTEDPVMTLTRLDSVPLESGLLFVICEFSDDDLIELINRGLESLAVTMSVQVLTADTEANLEQDQWIGSTVEDGKWKTFVVDVPETATALRIDLDGSQADLDVLLKHSKQVEQYDSADIFAVSGRARETVVVDADSEFALRSGRWFVDVYSNFKTADTSFRIRASFDQHPPPELFKLPVFESSTDKKQNALQASIEIATQTGGGSGTIVSPQGLILTNYHVIQEAIVYSRLTGDTREQEVAILMTDNPANTPVEYFVGSVVRFNKDLDLALVKITRGYYNQELPDDYAFPFVPIRNPDLSDLGSEISLLGYPINGAVENNPTLHWTRGNLCGFAGERYIKTDSDMVSGNSGGGLFDSRWNLIGIPAMTIETGEGSGSTVGICISAAAIPESWLTD